MPRSDCDLIFIGGRAVDLAENPTGTPLAKDAAIDMICDRHGRQYVNPGHPFNQNASATLTASGNTDIIAAPSAGKRIVVTRYSIFSDEASANSCQGKLAFDTGSTLVEHPGIAKGSGIAETGGGASLGDGPDGKKLVFSTDDTAKLVCNITYHIADG